MTFDRNVYITNVRRIDVPFWNIGITKPILRHLYLDSQLITKIVLIIRVDAIMVVE